MCMITNSREFSECKTDIDQACYNNCLDYMYDVVDNVKLYETKETQQKFLQQLYKVYRMCA